MHVLPSQPIKSINSRLHLETFIRSNISPKIVRLLEKDFPNSRQVRHVDLESASDSTLFDFAKNQGFTIVTFDSDFVDLNVVKGIPPKIIWLRTGNMTTKNISNLISSQIANIQNFINSKESEILEILDIPVQS